MSVKAMTWAWSLDLKPGPKFVLIALADHSDGSGVCWPGHELIAEKCGLTRQTVLEHIAILEASGLIVAERSRDPKGRMQKTRYLLQLSGLSTQPADSENPTLGKSAPIEVGRARVGKPDSGPCRDSRHGATSGNPTRGHVGISGEAMSGFPVCNKEEPKAFEPNPQTPLFELGERAIGQWFESQLWPRYPKQVRKSKALAVLLEMKPDQAMLDEILAGLEHRLAAELGARAKGDWFRAWPDPHRWLRGSEQQWRDRFGDVSRETSSSFKCVTCGAAAVVSKGGKWFCRADRPTV